MKQKLQKKGRTNNGITLIALVITIIVLLILAGVSIATLTGPNGILSQAQNAKNKTDEARADEKNRLADMENKINDYMPKAKTLVELYDEGAIEIGDYINYDPGEEGSYDSGYGRLGWKEGDIFEEGVGGDAKYVTSIKEQNVAKKPNWMVMGVEGEGEGENRHLNLISDVTLTGNMTINYNGKENRSAYEALIPMGAKGYINLSNILNESCAIYGIGKGAKGARNVTLDDINKLAGVTVKNPKEVNWESNENALNPPVAIQDEYTYPYGKPYSIPKGDKNGWTPETWINPNITESPGINGNQNFYSFSVLNPLLPIRENKKILNVINGKYYGENMDYNDIGGYYMANAKQTYDENTGTVDYFYMVYDGYEIESDISEYEGNVATTYTLFNSGEEKKNKKSARDLVKNYGPRPVVELEPGVTLEDLQKIDNPN